MIRSGNRLTLLENGVEYFPALIAAMDAAVHEIHLETYIFAADARGQEVAAALLRAAKRGVATRLLLDGFGSRRLSAELVTSLRDGGVQMSFFRPEHGILRWRRYRLRRLHRKLAVVDARIGFVGGINVSDDPPAFSAPRADFAVQVEGPLVADIHAAARRLWRLATWSAHWPHVPPPRAGLEAAHRLLKRRVGLHRDEDAWISPDRPMAGAQQAELLIRDNFRHRRRIEHAYLRAIGHAREEILIANAYFLPGRRFRQALAQAARRGVRVILVMQGHSDHHLYQAASRALYRFFLESGMEIHEYHASELHAKVAVVDGHWATVGSSNIDPFSLLLAREANLVTHDPVFACDLRERILAARDRGAHRIHHQAWRRIPWLFRLFSWLAFGLVRALMGLAGYAQAYDDRDRQ